VGKTSAETLKEELGLGSTFEDAVDSWIIGSKAMNVKISLQRKQRENEVTFDHLYCPMWEHFKRKGSILCEDVCFPAAEAMAKQICNTVEVVVLRKPDRNHTCIKALKRTG